MSQAEPGEQVATSKKKIDAFAPEVETDGTDQSRDGEGSGRGDSGVLSVRRGAVVGGVGALFVVFALVVLSTNATEPSSRRGKESEGDERPTDGVRLDPNKARDKADVMLDEAVAAQNDGMPKATPSEDARPAAAQSEANAALEQGGPVAPGPVMPGVGAPGGPGAPTPGGDIDPWAQARAQHRAADAQTYYQQIRSARSAGLFFNSGSPADPSGGQANQARANNGYEASGRQSEELEAFRSRLRAVSSAGAQGPAGPGATPGVGGGGAQTSPSGRARARDEAFYRGALTVQEPREGGSQTGRPRGRTNAGYVEAGTLVHAVLLTGLDSTLPGQVLAQVAQPVWDRDISRVVIPSGARLIGLYNTSTRPGQARLQVAWTRLVMPDGRQVELASLPGTGFGGEAGVEATVDEHFDDLLAGAALAGVFAASAAVTAGPVNALSVQPAQQGLYGGAGALQEAGAGLTERALAIEPTLTVGAGARVGIMVMEDLWL
jgi:type IV secretion system protein VirB10